MGGAVQEIAEKSEAVYEEYKRALATFGAEPAALETEAEGGRSGLLDWLLE